MRTKSKIGKAKKTNKHKKILNLLKTNASKIDSYKKNVTSDIWSERSNNLRENMLNRIKGAKFRILNEKLCTLPSNQVKKFFENNFEDYNSYQSSYQHLQEEWPEKPVDKIISYLKKKSSDKIIADMGCGKGILAQSLKNQVYSFDLVSSSKNIIACDMSKVPLSDESVDIVVFCLSLMGKDLTPFIVEANRILKKRGILLIAELTSRFDKVNKFFKSMEDLGFTLIKKDLKNNCFWLFEFNKSSKPKSSSKLIIKPFLYKKR